MEITKKITSNLESRRITETVDAVQCDSNTRVVEVTLRSGEEAWVPPEGVTASVAFEKPDDTSGWYDTLPTGDAACTVAGNVVRATLAPEVLTAAGRVSVAVVFMDANLNRLTTFPFILTVHKSPAAGNSISNSYYNLKTLQEINDAMAASNTKLKSAILCTEQALDSVQQAQARKNIGAQGFGERVVILHDGNLTDAVLLDNNGHADNDDRSLILNAAGFRGEKVIMRHLAPGEEDSDAVTKKQLDESVERGVLGVLVDFGMAPVYLDADGAVLTDGDDVIFTNN